MKKIALFASILGLLLGTTTASALTYKSVTRTNGNAAVADWQTQSGDVVTDKFISADVTKTGVDVSAGVCTYNVVTSEGSCNTGYSFTADKSVFTVNKLSTATLAPTVVELYDGLGNEVGSVTVKASWTGSGTVQKGSYKFTQKYSGFTEKYSDQSSYRDASATGSFDGDLGASSYGSLIQFKAMDMVMVK